MTRAGNLKATALIILAAVPATHAEAAPPPPAPMVKNWAAPAYKIKAQALIEAFMARHPEVQNTTFHGVPPGKTQYTMFAGTFPDRVGNASAPHDIVVLTDRLISLETRFAPTDNPRKAVAMIPLRDNSGKDIATAVFAFSDVRNDEKASAYYISAAIELRDELMKDIRSYDDLFAPAK